MNGLKSLFTFKRLVLTLVCFILLFIMWKVRQLHDSKWYYYPAPCKYSQENRKDSYKLATNIHEALKKESIAHTLCYGSLWGALRDKDLLPWDPDVEFCVYSEDMDKVDEQYFYRLFKKADVDISYDSYNGVYSVSYGQASGELVLFELSEDFIWLQRVGALSRMFNEEKRERFPSKLMAPPLPWGSLAGHKLPIPVNDIEIQKYFYPDDWWKVVKPKGCK